MLNTKFIAYYLPQFHAIPENDAWWGEGFTEWTNVKKALPLFKNHYQPRIPSDLGYYSLLDTSVMQQQSDLANAYGIDGFCWWHYWFGNGKRLLEKPGNLLLKNKEVSMNYCFAWANESWSGIWFGEENRILMEQKYCGEEDDINHFYEMLPFFKDERYIRHNDRPLFLIYRPLLHPYLDKFIRLWQELAIKEGLKGIYFVGFSYPTREKLGALDALVISEPYFRQYNAGLLDKISRKFTGKYFMQHFMEMIYGCHKMSYKLMVNQTHNYKLSKNQFPTLLTGWDNTPRSGKRGRVFSDYTPSLFESHVIKGLKTCDSNQTAFCFLRSWNEWAEGNYLEPDQRNGYSYLEAFAKAIGKN